MKSMDRVRQQGDRAIEGVSKLQLGSDSASSVGEMPECEKRHFYMVRQKHTTVQAASVPVHSKIF